MYGSCRRHFGYVCLQMRLKVVTLRLCSFVSSFFCCPGRSCFVGSLAHGALIPPSFPRLYVNRNNAWFCSGGIFNFANEALFRWRIKRIFPSKCGRIVEGVVVTFIVATVSFAGGLIGMGDCKLVPPIMNATMPTALHQFNCPEGQVGLSNVFADVRTHPPTHPPTRLLLLSDDGMAPL